MYTAPVRFLAAVMALGVSTLFAQAPVAPAAQEQPSRPSFAEFLEGVRTEAGTTTLRMPAESWAAVVVDTTGGASS